MNRNGSGSYGNFNGANEGIQVMACVQGNTARSARYDYDLYESEQIRYADDLSPAASNRCRVYDFRNGRTIEAQDRKRKRSRKVYRSSAASSVRHCEGRGRKHSRRKASAAAARRKIRYALAGVMIAFLITLVTGIGSRADMREIPKAYKYYDTITVGCNENLLDIVERYDNRDYYETQTDYVKELCRINNLAYDTTEYPNVPPGTHLVVPYYSEELK